MNLTRVSERKKCPIKKSELLNQLLIDSRNARFYRSRINYANLSKKIHRAVIAD